MNVVITGGSRGIGKSIAETFARHGHNIFLCARNERTLLQTAEELSAANPNVSIHPVALDISNLSEARMLSEFVRGKGEGADVLVNNAGSYLPGNVSDEEEGTLMNMLSVNLFSAYHTTRAFLPQLRSHSSSHIFFIGSIAGLSAYPGGGSYSISKFALHGMAKNLREELKNDGVKVTTVMPGAVYTDSWKGSGVSPSRIMEAKDIAQLIYSAAQLSPQATVEEILVRPQLGDL